MNCRAIESLLLAETDGVLTGAQHASLEEHLTSCPACRQLRGNLAEALAAIRTDAVSVALPDVEMEWSALRARIHRDKTAPEKQRKTAPGLWFGAALATAAALAVAFWLKEPLPSSGGAAPVQEVASAEFVETGDAGASTLVYVDKESGWLVVWAADDDKGEASG